MTLLREPIRRICSAYTFWRRTPENSFLTSKAKDLSFAGFVRYFEHHPMIISNPYTHHFAGIRPPIPAREFPDRLSLLAAAKHNLSAFDFIGISEEYERSARLLCAELGWQLPLPLPHENRSGSEDQVANIDEETMLVLRDCNQLDFELYAYGIALFQEREKTYLSCAGCHPDSRDALRGSASGLAQRTRQWSKANSFLLSLVPSTRDRKASITGVSATLRPDGPSQVLELAVRFQTRVKIPDLTLGVAVFDATGNNVWGTNTFLEELELQNEPECECGAVFVVQCEAPSGTYSVTVALHQPQTWGFHDHWLDRATSFEVVAEAGGLDAGGFKLRQFRSTVHRD